MSLQREILSPVTTNLDDDKPKHLYVSNHIYPVRVCGHALSCITSTIRETKTTTKKTVWNKGLTKETDVRVRKNAESLKRTLENNPEIAKNRAIEQWKDPKRREKQSLGVKQSYVDNPNLAEIRKKSAEKQWEDNYDKMVESLRQEYVLNIHKECLNQLWSDEKFRDNQHKKRSETHKELWKNPIYREKKHKELSQNKNTSIEIAIAKGLNSINIPFTKQFDIEKICFADIVLKPIKIKVVIFCDGDYWHNFPNGTEKDKKQTEKLQNMGWIVLRFWEHEIKKNLSECLEKINTVYRSSLPSLFDKDNTGSNAQHGGETILSTVQPNRVQIPNCKTIGRIVR